jgi:ubiquinone/menaquinone biosynthesis C-methylase UbiE
MADDFQLSSVNAAEQYESHVLTFMQPFVDAVVQHAAVRPGSVVLDVACGTGIVARRVAEQELVSVKGVDLNGSMIAMARRQHPQIEWVQGPAEALPFDGATFDVVTCQQGMQFFDDVVQAAREMWRVLKPGGRVVATVWAPRERLPYFATQFEAMSTYVDEETARSQRSAILDDGDEYLQKALTEGGFDDVQIEVVEAVVKLPEIGQYAQEQVLATPWGQSYEKASNEAQEAFAACFRANLGQYAQGDGSYSLPFASYLASAVKRA